MSSAFGQSIQPDSPSWTLSISSAVQYLKAGWAVSLTDCLHLIGGNQALHVCFPSFVVSVVFLSAPVVVTVFLTLHSDSQTVPWFTWYLHTGRNLTLRQWTKQAVENMTALARCQTGSSLATLDECQLGKLCNPFFVFRTTLILQGYKILLDFSPYWHHSVKQLLQIC